MVDVLRSDGSLHADELHIDTALALRDGGHWGQGYPEPLFDDVFAVVGWRVLKEKHLKLELQRGQQRFNAIQFNGWDGVEPARKARIAYRIVPDDWRGGEAIQLQVVHREAAAASSPA